MQRSIWSGTILRERLGVCNGDPNVSAFAAYRVGDSDWVTPGQRCA
jgi:hypothetical protein